jgi:hypothetical protein
MIYDFHEPDDEPEKLLLTPPVTQAPPVKQASPKQAPPSVTVTSYASPGDIPAAKQTSPPPVAARAPSKAAAPKAPAARPTSSPENKEAVERMVSGLAGAAFEGIESVGSGINAILNFNKSVLNTAGQMAEPLLKPLDAMGVTSLVRRPVEAVVNGVEERVTQLEEKGRDGLTQTGNFTIQAIGSTIDAVIEYLSTHPQVDKLILDKIDKVLPLLGKNPAVQKLVRQQVDVVLPDLADDPRIQELIQKQAAMYLAQLGKTVNPNLQGVIRTHGDDYVQYLNAHPESVQNLVAGQTIGLTTEIMNEVRERAVTADSVAEMIVRRLLRRKQRDELPAPPPEVQRRAEAARLPSDFFEDAARTLPPPNGAQGGGTHGL